MSLTVEEGEVIPGHGSPSLADQRRIRACWYLPGLHDVWVEGRHIAPSLEVLASQGANLRVGSSQHFSPAKRKELYLCRLAGWDWVAFT